MMKISHRFSLNLVIHYVPFVPFCLFSNQGSYDHYATITGPLRVKSVMVP